MKKLNEILYRVPIEGVSGSTGGLVTDITLDSRNVIKNGMFVAINGHDIDGHNYIDEALRLGASSIVCERLPKELHKEAVYIQVSDSRAALGYISNNFFGTPSSQLNLVGVTGTNGKTTVATLLLTFLIIKKRKQA